MKEPEDPILPENSSASPQSAKKKIVVSRRATPTSSKGPVVVRRSSKGTKSVQASTSFTTTHRTVIKSPTSKAPVRKQLGEPDFKNSIVSRDAAEFSRKPKGTSIGQRLFFDAAIAVVALSFMLLTFLHL